MPFQGPCPFHCYVFFGPVPRMLAPACLILFPFLAYPKITYIYIYIYIYFYTIYCWRPMPYIQPPPTKRKEPKTETTPWVFLTHPMGPSSCRAPPWRAPPSSRGSRSAPPPRWGSTWRRPPPPASRGAVGGASGRASERSDFRAKGWVGTRSPGGNERLWEFSLKGNHISHGGGPIYYQFYSARDSSQAKPTIEGCLSKH